MRPMVWLVLAMLLPCMGMSASPALAQSGTAPQAAPAPADTGLEVLRGRWVRTEGGYMIGIQSVDPAGKLDAAYANPKPLPFSRAAASRADGKITVFLELRAAGYNGSTYTLTYDPGDDTLKGVFFQAVARQSFEVVFKRVN